MGFVKKEYGSGSSFLWKRVRLRGMKDFEVTTATSKMQKMRELISNIITRQPQFAMMLFPLLVQRSLLMENVSISLIGQHMTELTDIGRHLKIYYEIWQ